MEKKKLFKSKTQMVVYIFLTIVCLYLFIVIGKTDFRKKEPTDAHKFSNLYNLVDSKNLYIFSNAGDILDILNNKSGVIFLAFPKNKWANMYASILNNVCAELGIDKIYYYDFLKDRDESNATYETIVKKLESFVPVNDEGVQDIYAPTIIIVKDGKILAYYDEVSVMRGNITPKDYYTLEKQELIYNELKNVLLEYISNGEV